MKIIKESKEKLPIDFITQFVSKGWEEVGNLKASCDAIKKEFKDTKAVEDILQGLIDSYLIALGQMELHLDKKDYVELPEKEKLKEALEEGRKPADYKIVGKYKSKEGKEVKVLEPNPNMPGSIAADLYVRYNDRAISLGSLPGYGRHDSNNFGWTFFYRVLKDGTLDKYLEKLKESLTESAATRAADTDAQESAIHTLEQSLNKLQITARLGTKVGKYPQTVIMDIDWQDGSIYIEPNGSVEICNEPVDPDDVEQIAQILMDNGFLNGQPSLTESNEEDAQPIEAKKFEDENKTEIFTELPDYDVEVEQKGKKIEIELEPKEEKIAEKSIEIEDEWPEPDMSDTSDIEEVKAALANSKLKVGEPEIQSMTNDPQDEFDDKEIKSRKVSEPFEFFVDFPDVE